MTLLKKSAISAPMEVPAVEIRPPRATTASVAADVSSPSKIAFTETKIGAPLIAPRDAARPKWFGWPRYEHRGRSLPLDMLRGVAILLVIGRHYIVLPENFGWLQPLAGGWTTIGWAGVDLFFVLSGFLVSGLLFAEYRKHRAVDVGRFVVRRGFKIWPAYLVYLGFVAAWVAWKQRGDLASTWATIWPNVFHVQNYFHTPRVHTWSLAVEEHFYLAVALAFYWVLRTGRAEAILRRLPAIILGLVAAIAVARYFSYRAHGPERLNLYATHLRFDGLLIGTLLAYWTHFQREKLAWAAQRPGLMLIVGLVLAAPVLALSPDASVLTASVGLTALYAGFGCILIGWLNLEDKAGWARRLFASTPAALLGQIGFYSYSIYLWHVDLAQVPIKKLAEIAVRAEVPAALVWVAGMVLYIGLAYVAGRLLGRLIEMPALKLRDRLFPSSTKAMAR